MNELKKSFEECTDEQLLKSFNSAKTAFTQLVRAHFLQRFDFFIKFKFCFSNIFQTYGPN